MQPITPLARNLLFINIAIFIAQNVLAGQVNLVDLFGFHYFQSSSFQPYQLITYMFLHANLSHIFGNMLALYMFGSILEHLLGAKRFLIFYLVCGTGAALFHAGIHYIEVYQVTEAANSYFNNPTPIGFENFLMTYSNDNYQLNQSFINQYLDNPKSLSLIEESKTAVMSIVEQATVSLPMIGASGSVFGILVAFGMIFPNLRLMLLFPPIPMKAKYLVSIYIVIEVLLTIRNSPTDNVAHLAHLGGALVGFIMIKIWYGNRHQQI